MRHILELLGKLPYINRNCRSGQTNDPCSLVLVSQTTSNIERDFLSFVWMFIIKWLLAAGFFFIVFKNPFNHLHCIPWLQNCWSSYEKLIMKLKLTNKNGIEQAVKADFKKFNLPVLQMFLIGVVPLHSTELW